MGKAVKLNVWEWLGEIVKAFCVRHGIREKEFISTLLLTAIFHDRTAVIYTLTELGHDLKEANELARDLYDMVEEILYGEEEKEFSGVL